MTTNPRSPTPPRRAAGWLLRALVLLALGGAAYIGLEVADAIMMDRLAGGADDGAIQVIQPPAAPEPSPLRAAPSEGPGNVWVRRAADALQQRASVVVRVDQRGWIDGEAVETSGRYYQLATGDDLQFLLEQTGQFAGAATHLLRVSDSRFLWTDLAWGDPSNPSRKVTRVDLRRVRRALADAGEGADTQAAASLSGEWSRFGGLPMLLTGLEESFAFGPARLMELRGERVAAMVGRWRPERLAQLTSGPPASLAPRAPQHVVIALSEETLFPLLIEYRDAGDALSAAGLPDEKLLTSSRRPLLKIDLGEPAFGERLDERLFTYRPSAENWTDQTDRELKLVRARRDVQAVAQAGLPAPR